MKKLILILALLMANPVFGQYTIGLNTAANLGGASQVATPTFSPVAGTYSSTQTVTISTTTPLAVLCYTTDGSTPTEVSNLCSGGTTATYSTPITVSTTQTVKALGTLATYTDSAVGSALYTITGGGGTPAPVGTPACFHSTGNTITASYTPYAAGDALLASWSVGSATATLNTPSDNGLSGGSTYTVLSGQTGQHGAARSLQIAYTLSLAASVTTITFTSSGSGTPTTACLQEFSGVSAVANLAGTAYTSAAAGAYSQAVTLANGTDYLFLAGVAASNATAFSAHNGTIAADYVNGTTSFTWAQYVTTSPATGTINYGGGAFSVAGVDVQ